MMNGQRKMGIVPPEALAMLCVAHTADAVQNGTKFECKNIFYDFFPNKKRFGSGVFRRVRRGRSTTLFYVA
jgi:hypothetical protein